MSEEPVRVGIVGCGNISGIYLEAGRKFEILDIVACSDLVRERAEAQAGKYDVPRACTTEELLADPAIEIVVNLTPPAGHYQIAKAAIEAGKSIYNEKPLAVTRDQGRRLLEAAERQGVLIGGAPDTFMGAGGQTCRELIDEDAIGRPVAATAFMMCHGHETWHPDPEFFYKPGGGPMFDMGPYYLTALVNLLGAVWRVTGSAQIGFPERTITSEPHRGETVEVEIPTHIAGVMDFAEGAVGTIITSFDVYAAQMPCIQVFGSEGTLNVPDPNTFDGTVRLWRKETGEWEEVPLRRPYQENSRGLGVADMATALRTGRTHRASGELTSHVLDIMCAFHDASREGRHIELESTCNRPAPLPADLDEGKVDS
ncbi:MAG: Gfo/Idh/MocA family oxidoreductase [Candidatus Brocadiia bacterium]